MHASRQWANRPDDERFWNLPDMLVAAKNKQTNSKEGIIKLNQIEFVQDESDPENGLLVRSSKGGLANISNLAFNQISNKLNYPVSGIIDKLNAKITCDVLNYRKQKILEESPDDEILMLLERGNQNITIRSINSERYARVYDAEIIPFAQKLQSIGWKIPPARPNGQYKGQTRIATDQDIVSFGKGGLQVRVGDTIAPAGLYMGDRDMFIFMINDKDIVDDGMGNALMRGVFICNSEVGTKNFSITEFICQGVCGNHIVWGATDIVCVRYRHVGNAYDRINEALNNLTFDHTPKDWTKEIRTIEWMRNNTIGDNKDDVIENTYKTFRDPCLTQKVLHSAYNNAEQYEDTDGNPNTWYGISNAITRYSQTLGNADKRHDLDTVVGKIYDKASKMLL